MREADQHVLEHAVGAEVAQPGRQLRARSAPPRRSGVASATVIVAITRGGHEERRRVEHARPPSRRAR